MKQLATHLSGYFKTATAPMSLRSKAFPHRPKVIFVILLSVSLLLLLQSQSSQAQAPQQFSFQGVARGADGKIVSNKEIGYSFNIHKGTPVGAIKFTREGSTTTDANGIFNVTIGTEAYPIPNDIRWDRDQHFLEVGIDIDGAINGYTFTNIGTTELISVPYALYAQQSGKWADGNPIVQTDTDNGYGDVAALPTVGNGPRLIWHPVKSAFRAGLAANNYWEDAQIGIYSFAVGKGTRASASESTSLGSESQATGQRATAIGYQAIASGANSIALGNGSSSGGGSSVSVGSNSIANADQSIALGLGTTSKSFSGIVAGNFNDVSDNPNSGSTSPNDRLFQIGNGTSNASRSNALTVLRNGNIGVGSNVLAPEYVMDFGSRPRVRHNGATAGIHFNNSQNQVEGFVGMKTDAQLGLYLNNAWKFWSDEFGNAWITGTGYYLSSDKRLKTNINQLNNSLFKLSQLRGYNYRWIDQTRGKNLATGVIAQELQTVFPELVSKDDKGFFSVNYTGLIPHLIEAVKELDKKTEEIATLKKELASVQEMNKKLSALEASVKELLAGKAATSTQTSK